MELSWSTFLLEIINFLVLVWILKRFLYRPVLSALEKRRQSIQETLDQAARRQDDAVALERKYQGRLQEWEQEKQQARQSLEAEIQAARSERLRQLQKELEEEREKADAVEQRRQSEMDRHYQQQAHRQAARFAGKILTAVAGPEMDTRLFDLFIDQLQALDEEDISSLRGACRNHQESLKVTSATVLSDEQKQRLQHNLDNLCGKGQSIEYHEDAELVAGLRITLGARVLRLNLHDELRGFSEMIHEPFES